LSARRFEGRSVLVTGAASGIGRATALRLAQEGASLVLADVDDAGLSQTAERCEDAGAVHTHACDVADEGSVAELVARAVDDLGGLDVLCNVAGILAFEDFRSTTLEQWNRILAVNLTGTFLVCREALPHLLERGGNIVNTASTAALAGHPWTAPYSASKGGVLALSLTLAVEFGKLGVRCNVVAPGSIETPIQDAFRLPEGADAKLLHRIMALDKMRGPETVAGAIAFLASDDGAHVNGEVLRVDGGTLA
jgi:NAD(P)-dependent dehydrogenase (short-subunit alcohol dehydrogenase family)